jgi:NAD(P)-dependent dehydrogenase (short-subunit alcohol dehydrogenase family)
VKQLAGRVAVSTGAASGIGRALADRCAWEGMKVVLADVEALAEKTLASFGGVRLLTEVGLRGIARCPPSPSYLLARRSKEAKLVERVEVVGDSPVGDDLAVDDLVDDNLDLTQSLAGRRD